TRRLLKLQFGRLVASPNVPGRVPGAPAVLHGVTPAGISEPKPFAIKPANSGFGLTVWKLPFTRFPTYRTSKAMRVVSSRCTPRDHPCVYGSRKSFATRVFNRVPGFTPVGMFANCRARTSLPKSPELGNAAPLAVVTMPAFTTGAAVATFRKIL